MKKLLALVLAMLMLTGCAQQSPGTLLPDDTQPDAPQTPTTPEGDLIYSLAYYPERSMNPYQSTDYTNRVLFSLKV